MSNNRHATPRLRDSIHWIRKHLWGGRGAQIAFEPLFNRIVDMALPAAVRVAVGLLSSANVEGIQSYRFQAVGANVAQDEVGFRDPDTTRSEITVGSDDPESLAVIAAREVVWSMCVPSQDSRNVGLVLQKPP